MQYEIFFPTLVPRISISRFSSCHSLSVSIPALPCPALAASNPFKLPYPLPSFLHLSSAPLTLKLSLLFCFGNPDRIMLEKREDLFCSQAELREESSRKWPWMKAVVCIFSTLIILSASVVLAGVHPANIQSAEIVAEVSRWMESISSSSFCPCLYIILNILILILGFKSTSASASASPSTISSHYYPCQCSQLYHKPEALYESHANPSFETLATLKPERKAEETQSVSVNGEQMLESLAEHKSGDKVKAAENQKSPALVLQRSCSVRELHCKKVKKPSNLSRESSRTQPLQSFKCGDVAPVEVIFEICSVEEGGDDHCDQEKEGNLTREELNAKAESFIGNFYRELKMQREDSWKRLCALYRTSC